LSCPLLCSRCDPRRLRFSWFQQPPTAGAPCEAFFSRRARRAAVSWSLCLKRRCGSWCAQTSRSVPCVAGHTQYLRLVSVSRPPAHLLMILSDLAASVFFRQHSSESTSRFPLRFRTPLVFRVRFFTNVAGSSLVRLEVSRFFCTAPGSALVSRSARCPVAS
jgi:hypothetical protein